MKSWWLTCLCVVLSTHTSTHGAISVFDTPTGPNGLRPMQECGDLSLWLDWLVAQRALPGADACGGLPESACAALARRDAKSCAGVGEEVVTQALDRVRARYRDELWNGTAAFTISAWNNWAVVRVFLESLLRANPSLATVVWFVADRFDSTSQLVREIKREFEQLAQRHMPRCKLRIVSLADLERTMLYSPFELAFRYELKTFNTAIKPHVFDFLLGAEGFSSVVYFDPDILFFDSLDEVALLLQRRSIVVTPHILREYPADPLFQTDLQMLRVGLFNFGFIAISKSHPAVARHFLAWWGERLRFQGGVDLSLGLHFDQGWGTFITSFYPQQTYAILSDPRFNAAYWNLHYTGSHIRVRNISHHQVEYDGAPLVFFHFSGISTQHFEAGRISPHQTRYKLSDFPNLVELVEHYATLMLGSNHSSFSKLPYGFDSFNNGVRVQPWLRAVFLSLSHYGRVLPSGRFRDAPIYVDRLRTLNSDPFDTRATNSFWRWLCTASSSAIVDEPAAAIGVPNGANLLLSKLGHSASACGSGATVTTWFASFGSFLAAYASESSSLQKAARLVQSQCQEIKSLLSSLLSNQALKHSPTFSRPTTVSKFCLLLDAKPHSGFGSHSRLVSTKVEQLKHRANSQPLAVRSSITLLVEDLERACDLAGGQSQSRHPPHQMWAATISRLAMQSAWRAPTVREGVNLFGHLGGVFGIGHEANYLYAGIREHLAIGAISLPRSPSHVYRPFPNMTRSVRFGVSLWCVNADSVSQIPSYFPESLWSESAHVGYWAWELDDIPRYVISAAFFFDEIWAVSSYAGAAIRRALQADPLASTIPVRVDNLIGIPNLQPLDEITRARAANRALFGFSSEYVFLIVFDCRSVIERKNPFGTMRAFNQAFAANDTTVKLVVKHINCPMRMTREIERAAHGRSNVMELPGHFPDAKMLALRRAADCYVSLHLAEGYGLNLLEAILDGTPLVYTDYGGSTDFTSKLPAVLSANLSVPCERTTLAADAGPYKAGNTWCVPNLAHASRAFKFARDNALQVKRAARAAVPQMRAIFGASQMGGVHSKRLKTLASDFIRTKRSNPQARPPKESIFCYWVRHLDVRMTLGTDGKKVQEHYDYKGKPAGRSSSCAFLSSSIIRLAMSKLTFK